MVKLSFRIVGSIFFNVMNMARVDKPVFSAGFEGFDAGYSAYIAMLLHDHDTSHPVVLAFCRHMLLTVWSPQRIKSLPLRPQCGGAHIRSGTESDYNEVEADDDKRDLLSHNAADDSAGPTTDDEEVMSDGHTASTKSGINVMPAVSTMLTSAKRRARTRWFLAITLANNRGLIASRKHRLEKFTHGRSFASRMKSGIRASAVDATQKVRSFHLPEKLSSIHSAVIRKTRGGSSSYRPISVSGSPADDNDVPLVSVLGELDSNQASIN